MTGGLFGSDDRTPRPFDGDAFGTRTRNQIQVRAGSNLPVAVEQVASGCKPGLWDRQRPAVGIASNTGVEPEMRWPADVTQGIPGNILDEPPASANQVFACQLLSPSRETLAAKVAAFFKARPGIWIDGREVLKVAGAYGWRTRISDCRRAPYNLRIDNRQRRVDGYTVSEYMLVSGAEKGGAA